MRRCVLLLAAIAVLVLAQDQLTPVPAEQTLVKATSWPFVKTPRKRLTDPFAKQAMQLMLSEKAKIVRSPIIPLNYDSPTVKLFFKDESQQPTGTHFLRVVWNVFAKAIRDGHIKKDTVIIDMSPGGISGVTVAHFAKLLSLESFIFVTHDTTADRIAKMQELGSLPVRVPYTRMQIRAEQEASSRLNAYFLNTPGNAAAAEEAIGDALLLGANINLLEETIAQSRDGENGLNDIDAFICTVGTGALISSVGRSAIAHSIPLDVVAVDSQFSVYYDWVTANRFTTESGELVWRPPGLAGVGAGPLGSPVFGNNTSLRKDVIDRIIKLPDIASVSAIAVLRDLGIDGGPSTAANFLASLHYAANSSSMRGEFLDIVTVITDSGTQHYSETYLNETWIANNFYRHGGMKAYNCWKKTIEDSLSTGWDPITTGLDKGCAVF